MRRDRRALRALLAPVLAALIVLASAAAAQAATITVTTNGDPTGAGSCLSGGSCSLRQAVAAASSGDTIVLGSLTYSLTQGTDVEISKSITIEGAGVPDTVVDGGSNFGSRNGGEVARILRVDSGATVTILDLTLSHGLDEQDENCSNGCSTINANGGGALFNNGGTVVLDNVAFANDTGSGNPLGGAVSNGSGSLTMNNVSFTGDSAGVGGALFTRSGTVTGNGVSFENNGTTCCDGGAMYLLGGTVTLANTTIVTSGGYDVGGAIANAGATLTLDNVTMSNNGADIQTDPSAATNVFNTILGGSSACVAPGRYDDLTGARTGTAIDGQESENIDQGSSCNLSGTGDQSSVDPHLVPIFDNGGPANEAHTLTEAIVAGSPALGDPSTTNCPAADQRGVARPQGSGRPNGSCDIGAFEAQLLGPPTTPTTGAAQNVTERSADLPATINLRGEAGGFHFVYGTSNDPATWVSSAEIAAGVVTEDTSVSQTLSSLSPGTTYYYAAVADNASDSKQDTSPPQQFTTAPGPPLVGNVSSSVTDTTATINFTIDPQGADTTYVVQYGTDGYTQHTDRIDIGSTPGPQDLSATLDNLSPGTTYHFDVVATNSQAPDGVDSGDQTFTTDKQVNGTAGSPVTLTDTGTTTQQCPTQVTIDWGDGGPTSQGQISCTSGANDSDNYTATATHVYAQAGGYQIQVEYPQLDSTDGQYAHIAQGQLNTPNVSQSPVSAGFYPSNPNSPNPGDFFNDWQGGSPLWMQTFSIINFDDDPSQDPPGFCPAPTGDSTLPFTDGVSLNPPANTSCSYVVAQNPSGTQQAGVDTSSNPNGANLIQFTSVMTGSYTVNGPGELSFNSYSDDGFSLGIGPSGANQPVYTSGSNDLPSASTAINGYDIVGSDEGPHGPSGDTFTVYFPAAGTYPFELDYDECCQGTLEMTLSVGGTVLQAPPGPSGSTGSVSTQTAPPPTAPAVTGGAPTGLTINGASVSGTVNPDGAATQAYFQYGLDLSQRGPGASTTLYDQSTPAQNVGSDSSSHTVSGSLTGLDPGALYHVRLVATNSAGTTYGPDQPFTADQTPPPAAPVLGQSENAKPVSGLVFIRNANGQFVPLTGAVKVTSGTVIDALHGSLELLAAIGKGQTDHGIFGGAVFRVTQDGAGRNRGLTTLAILEGLFQGAPSYALCTTRKAADAKAASLSSKTLQLLHASAHGKFTTSGRYSAATVRGTIWTVADRCDGTLTHDVTDSVAVTDFVHHKTIILHAGQSYLALAPKHHK